MLPCKTIATFENFLCPHRTSNQTPHLESICFSNQKHHIMAYCQDVLLSLLVALDFDLTVERWQNLTTRRATKNPSLEVNPIQESGSQQCDKTQFYSW